MKLPTLILFFFLLSCSSLNKNSVSGVVVKRTLAVGKSFNWQIFEITDNGNKAVCFFMTSGGMRNSMEIGIIDAEEMKDFISHLKSFASYSDKNDLEHHSDAFNLFWYHSANEVKLTDKNGYFLTLTKQQALDFVFELEKSLSLME